MNSRNSLSVFFSIFLTLTVALAAHGKAQLRADFDSSRFLGAQQIPANIAAWMYLEQEVNNRDMGSNFIALDHNELDPRFDPKNRPVVLIGYLEIPREQAAMRIDLDGLSKRAKQMLFFKRDGKDYVRFFIHPLMEEKYAPEIKMWGKKVVDKDGNVVSYSPHYGDYVATLTSSLRSFVAWKRSDPSVFIGPKTSLAVNVQTDRKNDLDKLERAFAVSQLVRDLPQAEKDAVRVDFLLEPMVQSTAGVKDGKTYGNINRDYGDRDMVHPNGKSRYVPGFALTSAGPRGGEPMLIRMIRESGQTPEDFIQERVMGPLIRAGAYLGFDQGLVSEMHQQNVLFELDERGRLTGNILIRDLDAFKPDILTRVMRGLSAEPFLSAKRPYKLLKMGKAKNYYRLSYDEYIKSNWLENVQTMLGRYGMDLVAKSPTVRRQFDASPLEKVMDEISERADKTLLLEMTKRFGFETVFNAADMEAQETVNKQEYLKKKGKRFGAVKLKVARQDAKSGTLDLFIATYGEQLRKLLPEVNWQRRPLQLTDAQAEKVVSEFWVAELFVREEMMNSPLRTIFDTTAIVDKHKSQSPLKIQPGVNQEVLAKEYERLVFNYRHSSQKEVPRGAFYVLNKGIITAVSAKGEALGFAFLEPRSVIGSETLYYAGSTHPRVEPNRAVLKMLYDYADGRISRIPAIHTQRYAYPAVGSASQEDLEESDLATVRESAVSGACRALFK